MKKIICLLCVVAMLTSCGKQSDSNNNISENNIIQETEKTTDDGESADTSAYIVIPSGEEYVEMKSSIDNGSVLCRLYTNDEVVFNHSEQQWAYISANGFTGYVKLSNISFSAIEVIPETQPETSAQPAETGQQPPQETQPVAVQEANNESPEINIANNIENNITIQFDFDDFNVKYATPLSYQKYVENRTEGYCIVESCYIFSEPSSDSYKDVKYMLYRDGGVEILGSVDDWYFIRRDFGSQSYRIGYVPKSYIALGASPEIPPSVCSQVIVSKNSACINRYPKICEGDDVLGYASQGQVYNVYNLIDNYWYEIDYGSGVAYISHKMVEPY
ncbi:MAG: hypothetical protein K2J08_04135 [Ruminococcus sp.]|nr:hypothetical protein [Ruminococcus sp.]